MNPQPALHHQSHNLSCKNTTMSSRAASEGAKDSRSRLSLGLKTVLKSLVTGFLALATAWWLRFLSFGTTLETALDFFRPIEKDSYWDGHREEVKDAFVTSWDAYAQYAWGKFVSGPAILH